jgi:hippurate hydrolase
MRTLLAALALSSAVSAFAQLPVDQLKTQVTAQLPALEKAYLDLHQAPELSRQEVKTSAFIADSLKRLGYTVTDHIGVYPDGQKALGIVGILKNGAGPTVLIRTDMDALPVTEATGLPYASKIHAQTADHQDVGVMHACGHDLHMTVFLGTAKELADNKAKWHGTVVLVGQPSEEIIMGAKAMLADDFYKRFPKPDFILDEHDANDYPTGTIGMAPGPLLAASTSVYVTFHGIGSHGSTPHLGKDPIVMASEFVMMAQTIVSRQTSAQSPAVLTVGTFHAGTKNNIIPDDATLGLTLRSYDAKVMANMIADVRRTANAVAAAYGVADDRMPTITIPEETGPTINDAALEERMKKVAIATLGADRVLPAIVIMGSEDVGYFSLDNTIPFMIFRLGAADPAKFAEAKKTGKPLPGLHSALFAPVYKPAIETGVEAMTAMAVSLLQ